MQQIRFPATVHSSACLSLRWSLTRTRTRVTWTRDNYCVCCQFWGARISEKKLISRGPRGRRKYGDLQLDLFAMCLPLTMLPRSFVPSQSRRWRVVSLDIGNELLMAVRSSVTQFQDKIVLLAH